MTEGLASACRTRPVRAEQAGRGAIELDPKEAGCPPPGRYDLPLERRLRPLEIERQTLLARHGLSRLLDRLEGEGLIARERCDPGGQWIVPTDAGRAQQGRMWKVFARAIQRHLGDKLDAKPATAPGDPPGQLIVPAPPDAPRPEASAGGRHSPASARRMF